jgi:hypothetical protein
MHEEDVFVTAGRDKQVSFRAKGDFLSDASLGQSVGNGYRGLRLQMCINVKSERSGHGCRCEQDGREWTVRDLLLRLPSAVLTLKHQATLGRRFGDRGNIDILVQIT